MINNNDITRQYANAKRSIGSSKGRYSYYIDTNSYAELWYNLHNNLGYPLKVDSRHKRAIIYNKEGLQKQIEQMIDNSIINDFEAISNLIANNISIELDNIMLNAGGNVTKNNNKSSMSSLIGKTLGKSLVKGFFKILDEITDTSDDDRRRR